MNAGSTDPAADRQPEEVYRRLAESDPKARAEIVGRLISDHPEKLLALPEQDGLAAMLDELDLGARGSGRGADLRGADLRGARLRRARLTKADLAKADLRRAALGGADLRGADLAGVLLRGASLQGADLRDAMLEEADLRGARMRFCRLEGAALEKSDLRRVDLWGGTLGGAQLAGADLRRSGLREADLSGADLSGADLRGAQIVAASLRGAVLSGARLQGLDLSSCDIDGVHLSGAWLEKVHFGQPQLGGSIGEERKGDFDEARKGYLALERAFEGLGDLDAASWAYRRRRRMQKLDTLRRARTAGTRWGSARSYAQYASDQLVEWLCDYGESIPRVLGSLAILYVLFTIVYAMAGSVVREVETPSGSIRAVTRTPSDLAIFSLWAMTSGSIGERLLPKDDLALVLMGVHLCLGIMLIGLLGFVLGNRIRR